MTMYKAKQKVVRGNNVYPWLFSYSMIHPKIHPTPFQKKTPPIYIDTTSLSLSLSLPRGRGFIYRGFKNCGRARGEGGARAEGGNRAGMPCGGTRAPCAALEAPGTSQRPPRGPKRPYGALGAKEAQRAPGGKEEKEEMESGNHREQPRERAGGPGARDQGPRTRTAAPPSPPPVRRARPSGRRGVRLGSPLERHRPGERPARGHAP